MKKPTINLALIGSGFMGRAHSNALRQVRSFFDLPFEPVLKVLGARNPEAGRRVAHKFGWEEVIPDWREIVERPDIQLIDIATPVYTHAEIALAAMQAGKAVICEKPLAANLSEARRMAHSARQAGVATLCMFNIRATPAVELAGRLIREGAIGKVNQWRAAFQQSSLVDPDFPLTWRLRKETAGSGALGDLGSHSLDLARFLVGEIQSVSAMINTFTKERWIPIKDEGRNSLPSDRKGPVTVDDAVWSLLRFEHGAFGTMEATRMASGQLCANQFEVYGSQGGIRFDFMRMNELQFFSFNDPPPQQGWRRIHATMPVHPYAGNWWPPGHSLGYEHTFVNLLSTFFQALPDGKGALPDFEDAARTQAVIDAVERSAALQAWIDVEKL